MRKFIFFGITLLILTSCKSVSRGRNAYDTSKVDLTPVTGGTFVEASIGDASFLNPLLATDSASNDINQLVYNGLVKYDKNINLVGELASHWDVAQGGKVITFYIRPGIKWHDGQPLTAEDVLFTYQKLIDPKTRTAYSSNYTLVKKAEVVDSLTFRVTYKEPFAPAIESWGMGIIPKHIFEDGDINTHPANRNPIGTGPYIFKEWKTDEKITLTANPDYFEGRPKIDRYIYRIIPDLAVQFLELRQGSLSIMAPTPDQYNGYEEFFYHYNKFHYPAFRYDYMGFNLNNPLFKDRKVRLALAHAVNKNKIIQGVYQGLAVPATGPFPPASWANNPDVKNIEFDLGKAKTLLAEAGWVDSDEDGTLDKEGKPFTFTLVTNQGNKVRESIAQILQSNFEKVGVKMDIRIIEWSVFIHKFIDERQFDATLLGWNLSQDPDAYSIWHSSQMKKKQYNFVSYNNPEVDRLLEKGRRTFGIEKRKPIYNRIHELISHDVPYIFLVHGESLPVVHKKIIGVKLMPAGITWNSNEWYIPRVWQRSNFAS